MISARAVTGTFRTFRWWADAILIGESLADARLHWIECNGRWGGVSIPMTLANRLTGDWARHPANCQTTTRTATTRRFIVRLRAYGGKIPRQPVGPEEVS